jgi:hypothetical protein
MVVLLSQILAFYARSAEQHTSIYTIQIASLRKIETAHKQFEVIVKKLKEESLQDLRIEKIGSYYSLRLGKFKDYLSAETFLKPMQSQLPSAMVMKAYFIKKRIVRMYSGLHQTKAERVSEPDLSQESIAKAVPQDVRDYSDEKSGLLTEEQKKLGEPEKQEVKKEQKKEQTLAHEPLYSAGPWRGKILDSETKEPLEGVVVAAVWYREYKTRFTSLVDFHEAQEIVTDKEGAYEIPVYTETGEQKDSWQKPHIQGPEGPIELFIEGPIIKGPEFIMYKPGFQHYPESHKLVVYPAGSFYVEYPEYYKTTVDGDDMVFRKGSRKEFSAGLIYEGSGCLKIIEKLAKKSSYKTHSIFLRMVNAEEKMRNLDIPLKCPQDGEPIPEFVRGYKSDLKNPFEKGGFILVLMSKAGGEKDLKTTPAVPTKVNPEKLPQLYKYIEGSHELQKDPTRLKQE